MDYLRFLGFLLGCVAIATCVLMALGLSVAILIAVVYHALRFLGVQ